MHGPPRHLSILSFGIGLGVLASVVGDHWRHGVRGLAGQSLKNRPECKGLGMEVRCQLVPCQQSRYARLRHHAQHIRGDRMMTARILQDIDIDSPPADGFASFQGGDLWKLSYHGPGLLSRPTLRLRKASLVFPGHQDMQAGLAGRVHKRGDCLRL
jgi:hypothetical protein